MIVLEGQIVQGTFIGVNTWGAESRVIEPGAWLWIVQGEEVPMLGAFVIVRSGKEEE